MAEDHTAIEFYLARHAESAWRSVVKPWLEQRSGQLERNYVVVPTRGQAHGLKQLCLTERVPLLGVEFLSPGLVRKKWLSSGSTNALLVGKPTIAREFLVFGLRLLIDRRLEPLSSQEPNWGFWKSLQSDAERVLADFEELLRAGFRASDFPLPALRELFSELVSWVEASGYGLAPLQDEVAALSVASGENPLGDRVLLYGFSGEQWSEFFNLLAFIRRFRKISVVLPEPAFRGNRALDEAWIEAWQAALGVASVPIDEGEIHSCAALADWWDGKAQASDDFQDVLLKSKVCVGATREAEMWLVANEIEQLLRSGGENVAVVFPKTDAAHQHLTRFLAERSIAFVDLLARPGTLSIDLQVSQALLLFYERGARVDEVIEFWPLLRAIGRTELSPAEARAVCGEIFDECPSHALSDHLERLAESERLPWNEVGRIAAFLLPAWPERLTLDDALERCLRLLKQLGLVLPSGWEVVSGFSRQAGEPLPLREVLRLLRSLLPDGGPAIDRKGSSGFARVTLTTRRRAEGLAWSHVLLVEANAGIWPERCEPSCWLTDEQRIELNRRGRFSIGLLTGEDRTAWERQSYARIARDSRTQIVLSAALAEEQQPELRLRPNRYLERVLWVALRQAGDQRSIQDGFEQMAKGRRAALRLADFEGWREIWERRRNPAHPFDEYFFSVAPGQLRPKALSARLIEGGIADPAELWFKAVLKARARDWHPLLRTRQKLVGIAVHRVLANVLRGGSSEVGFGPRPPAELLLSTMREELRRLSRKWPQNRYWESVLAEVAGAGGRLLDQAMTLPQDCFMATEMPLPAGATIPLGGEGERLLVHGRMDLVVSNQPGWEGATVTIVDFKTGNDPKLNVGRMAKGGAGLQLGIYLAAAQSLGARDGVVAMWKSQDGETSSLSMEELAPALSSLSRLANHLTTGCYGALTRDRSDYAQETLAWPIACVAIPFAVLKNKYAVTFGITEEEAATDV